MKISRPFMGDQREVRKFLWFPTLINGAIYWLETVTIHQSYDTRTSGWCNDWVVSRGVHGDDN